MSITSFSTNTLLSSIYFSSFHQDGSILDPDLFDIYLSYYPKASARTPPPTTSTVPPYISNYASLNILLEEDDEDFPPLPPAKAPSSETNATQSSSQGRKHSPTIYDSELVLLLRGQTLSDPLMMSNDKRFEAFHHGSFLLYTQRGLLETIPLAYSCTAVSFGASVRDEATKDSLTELNRPDPLLAAYLNVHQPMKHLGYIFSHKSNQQKMTMSATNQVPYVGNLSSLPPILSNIPEAPKELFLCVDALKPGCAYSAVIDFHQPIALTDISIQSSTLMFSVAIDVWLTEGREKEESVRIAQSSELSNRSLMLGNIQPPPVCQFARVTYLGRMNAASEKCAVSLGCFFGKPYFSLLEASLEPTLAMEEARILSRYMKLREELEDSLSMYMNSPSSPALRQQMEKQVSNVHNSCFAVKTQLARLRNVMQQLENRSKTFSEKDSNSFLFSILAKQGDELAECYLPLKKLSKCMGCVVDAMLILMQSCITQASPTSLQSLGTQMDKTRFRNLFLSQCIHGNHTLHARLCAFLIMLCGAQPWWGEVLAELFTELFTGNQSILFDKERLAYTCIYLCSMYITVCKVQYSDGMVHYSTVQYSTVQYSTVQYSTVQYSAVQYSTV